MTDRIGNWIQTYTGRPFWPLDPRPDDIFIEDVARSLSMRCRYSGHVLRFYSVAEHSVHVSRAVPPEFALWGLLHDAAEAYSADVPRPLKRNLPAWAPLEKAIMDAVKVRFALEGDEPAIVKDVDFRICGDERAQILHPSLLEWEELPVSLGIHLDCFAPEYAERMFLDRFYELTNGGLYQLKTGRI